MSGINKTKVYQGVRVKTTVKELLQQRRALQAAERATQIYQSTDNSVQFPSHTSFAAPYYTAPANTAETNCFQPGQYTDNFSYEQMVSNALENQQIMDMLMQPDNYTASALYPMPIAQHGSYGNYQQGADHYNSAMAPSSISDSSNVSSPVDYSSYSPPQSYSSASSSYGSPTHVDPRHYGSIPEDCHSHHCTLPYGCCLSQAPSPQAHMNQLPEHIPYSTSDCLYSSAMAEESFIRREPNNWDMCYL
ncbi:POU class 2 homeobox associating factor 3 [Acipenser ruthenus]|uniref:POU class 2 homeobox associating factor 3 n=1 Tax=Acipenser ruthenus TaxID=7906 RepID=UPI0027409F58|nr:POU class 2 homeobox associating factor 3 [Acipenser ruthenus]